MLAVRLFYHVYASGAWSLPVSEYFTALRDSHLPGPLTIGLVGEPRDRAIAMDMIQRQADGRVICWLEADEGFEQLTLRELQHCAHGSVTRQAYLYCHTKGAFNDDDFNTAWRQSMIRHLVGGWRNCLKILQDGWDTAGCHWLTPERDNEPPRHPVGSPFYGGNFWWAATTYLKQLPPVGNEKRHDAEAWIGLAAPAAYDLLPGWPDMKLFTLPEVTERF